MKYRMLPRARSWVGWDAPAPCVFRECAGASLETGSFKTRLGPSGPRARTERTCLTCVLNWGVYWDCVLVVCPTWIRVSGSLLCVWRALPTELCVWRSRVCRSQVCLVKYLGVQRQDGNGEWCPLSVTWGVFTSVVAAVDEPRRLQHVYVFVRSFKKTSDQLCYAKSVGCLLTNHGRHFERPWVGTVWPRLWESLHLIGRKEVIGRSLCLWAKWRGFC